MNPDEAVRTWADATFAHHFIEKRARAIADRGVISFQPAYETVVEETSNDLAAGRLVAFGRSSEGVAQIQQSFWVGADIDWDRDRAERDHLQFANIRLLTAEDLEAATRAQEPVSGRSGPSVTNQANLGGRTNTSNDIRKEGMKLLKDPKFLNLGNRTDQARELRARLIGEYSRLSDHYAGYSTNHIKRIIGELDPLKKGSA